MVKLVPGEGAPSKMEQTDGREVKFFTADDISTVRQVHLCGESFFDGSRMLLVKSL